MPVPALGLLEALRRHWPEYAIEGWALGMFMISASVATVLLYDPRSPTFGLIENEFWKRALMALAMAGTAAAIIYSPWGKRSGAHMNPAFTLSFWVMGKINTVDAVYYALFQFVGGLCGSLLSYVLTGGLLADPRANWAVTVPGPQGVAAALFSELIIAFILMFVVAVMLNSKFDQLIGIVAGGLIFLYVLYRVALFGVWNESGAQLFFGAAGGHLDGVLGLSHSAAHRYAHGRLRAFLRARPSGRFYPTETQPKLRDALHPLRLRAPRSRPRTPSRCLTIGT